KVWSLCTGDYAAQVRFVFDVLDSMWDREVALMGKPVPDLGGFDGGGDKAIDIYLLDRWQCVRREKKCTDTNIAGENGEFQSALGIAPATGPKEGPAGARTASGYILL